MKYCEVCRQFGETRRGPYYREPLWFGERVGMDLCRDHMKALAHITVRIELLSARVERMLGNARVYIDQHGRESVLEVQ